MANDNEKSGSKILNFAGQDHHDDREEAELIPASVEDFAKSTAPISGITETIRVPDWSKQSDIPQRELAKVMRQLSRILNYTSSNITRVAAEDTSGRQSGAANQLAQMVFQAAGLTETVALNLENAGRVIMTPPPGGGSGGIGRA